MTIPHAPSDVRRLVQMFRHRAEAFADDEAFVFADETLLKTLDQRLDQRHPGITYAALDRRVRAVAAHLQACTRPGDRVVILEMPGIDFVVAWLACTYAGVVAVPLYPPDPARFARLMTELLRQRIDDEAPVSVVKRHPARGIDPAEADHDR